MKIGLYCFFHYAVTYKEKNGKWHAELYEVLKDALQHAKFCLYNYEDVEVISIDGSFSGKSLYTGQCKKRLKKVVE
jgi:hypothetical protein